MLSQIQSRSTRDLPIPQAAPAPQASDTQSYTSLDEFYQVIIDNNIFHPLGWQPTKKQPDYTLIGTAVSQNPSESQAFIIEKVSDKMHIVKTGETFGDALVKVILPKRVILNEDGKEIVLYCGKLQFH